MKWSTVNGSYVARSFVPHRSASERIVLEETKNSLLNALEGSGQHLTKLQYAYLCNYGTQFITRLFEKRKRGDQKRLHNQTMGVPDHLSLAGSIPLTQMYPPSHVEYERNQTVRIPDGVSSIGTMPNFQRHPSGISLSSSAFNPVGSHKRGFQTNHQNATVVPSNVVATIPEEDEDSESTEDSSNSCKQTSTSESERASYKPLQVASKQKQRKPLHVTGGATVLKEWYLKLVGQSLCVVGTTSNGSVKTTKPLIKYTRDRTIVTQCGSYVVQGESKSVASIPQFVKTRCKKGFPTMWRMLMERWLEQKPANKRLSTNTSLHEPKSAETTPKHPGHTPPSKIGSVDKSKKKVASSKKLSVSGSSTINNSINNSAKKQKDKGSAKKVIEKKSQSTGKTMKESTKVKKRPSLPVKNTKTRKSPEEKPRKPKKAAKKPKTQPALPEKSSKNDMNGAEKYDLFADIGNVFEYNPGRSMTPNGMLESTREDALIGVSTPPINALGCLFNSGGRTKRLPSDTTQSSLDSSKVNAVSERMSKNVEQKKKKYGGKGSNKVTQHERK